VIGTPLIDGGVAQHSVSRFEKPTKVRGTGRRGAQKFNKRHEQDGSQRFLQHPENRSLGCSAIAVEKQIANP